MRTQFRRVLTLLSALAFLITLATSAAAQQSIVKPNLRAMGISFAPENAAPVAQNRNTDEVGFGFGVEVGIVRSTVRFDNAEEAISGRTGTMFGIWFGGNRPGRVGVMGEIAYVVKGATGGGESVKIYYLEIPILIRVNVGSRSINGVSVYGIFGPVIDLKLKSKFNGVTIDDDGFKGVDIGIIGGIGFEALRFGLEARGNWGLRSIDESGTDSIKNFTFCILFKFRIT